MHGGEETRELGGVFSGVVSEKQLNASTDKRKLPGACKQISFFNWTEQWNCNLPTASLLKLWLCTAVLLYIWSSLVQHYLTLAQSLSDATSELTNSLSMFRWKKGIEQARNSWSGVWKLILVLFKEAMLMFGKTFDYRQPVRVFWKLVADYFIQCPRFGQCLASRYLSASASSLATYIKSVLLKLTS